MPPNLREERLERRLRRLGRVARLEPCEHLHPPCAAVVDLQPLPVGQHHRLHQDRHADLGAPCRIDPGKPRLRHADDRHGIVVDEDLLADDPGVTGKAAHPVVVGENDDRMALIDLIVFLRVEHAPGGGPDPQHGEEVAGDELGLEPFGSVVDADGRGHQTPAHDLGQRGGALLIVLVNRIRMHPRARIAAVVGPFLVEHDELVGVLHRELAKQNLVDQREDGRVCPDSQRQRQDGHGGKQRAPAQAAQCIPQVGKDLSHRAIGRNRRPKGLLKSRGM